ncbi:GntR family transcriptional regulator [Nocardia sp. R6R-6]|uniref:GntR family transcriptional regulator n=1 Tax=Nocardia sp. R6R-6 TaxID=3459303 RepID=UPI00403DD182
MSFRPAAGEPAAAIVRAVVLSEQGRVTPRKVVAIASASTVQNRSVADVINRLRDMIINRALLPGQQIRQEEMARVLGISRVPLREALRVLTTEGLLTHRPHQGYFVTRLNAEELGQIHNLLEFLETELIRTVRWPTGDEVTRLRGINREIATAAVARDVSAVNRLNRVLHREIFQLSPMAVYLAEAEKFWTMSEPYRLLHVATTDTAIATEEHDQLIDALAARDRALCLRILARHRRETRAAALTMLAGDIGYGVEFGTGQ